MIDIQRVDYANPTQAADLLNLLNIYALDPMGGGQPLDDYVHQNLIKALQAFNGAISLLAYKDERAVGLLNAFEGFSSFAARPLINIHDLMVLDTYRGQGIAQQLLGECESIAKNLGCCKITLEVLAGNKVAKASYRQFGFDSYVLDEGMGTAEFWQKTL